MFGCSSSFSFLLGANRRSLPCFFRLNEYNKYRDYERKGVAFVETHAFSRDELVHSVLPLLKKYHAEQAVLFGSYARQEATAQSDIDLVVIGGP